MLKAGRSRLGRPPRLGVQRVSPPRRGFTLVAFGLAVSLASAACGSDSNDAGATDETQRQSELLSALLSSVVGSSSAKAVASTQSGSGDTAQGDPDPAGSELEPASKLDPSVELFYAALANATPGAVGSSLGFAPITSAPEGSRAFRFGYVSSDATGKPVPVSAVVLVPDTPAPNAGFPIAAFAHGTAGLADTCAPSRRGWDFIALRNELLERGYVIFATDYIGLGTPGPHPYLDGPAAVRAVIDGIRATRAVKEFVAGNEVLLYGFSQGGQAALLTGEAMATATPDLHLQGVAALAPFTDMDIAFFTDAGALPTPTSSPLVPTRAFGAGVPLSGVVGLAAGSPGLTVSDVLTDEAQRRAGVFEQGCIQDANFAYPGPLSLWVKADVRKLPGWKDAISRAVPGATATAAPVFLAFGGQDRFMPPDSATALRKRLCRLGDAVSYGTFPVGHNGVVAASRAQFLAWLDKVDTARPNQCGKAE